MSQSLPTPGRLHALIVDDAMLIQRYVADILETVGVSSTFAEDGAAALLMTRNQQVDFILLDLAMPIMDGWEFLRELRANPETAAIPVLVITAHGQSGTATKVAELGAQGYLEKPFRRDQLLALVAPYLETDEDRATA
jgi:CheY-like chemotaxis protein